MRIQPHEIEVPKENPFANDLLDRKESVEVLTHLVRSFEGPCVLALDAAWGNGKTTFLRIWTQYLRNDGFPVVEFNAWDTDFSGDPFVALSTELLDGLQEFNEIKRSLTKTREVAAEVLRRAIPGVMRLATSGLVNLNPESVLELGDAFASYAATKVEDYQKAQKSFSSFKSNLQEIANNLEQSNENRPLIVVIDELDRCRPSYAVELLEIAKHLFAVDHIVFVMAVNRSELAHSIKSLYGNDFDARGYLRRFFDVDFRLPAPDRDEFIRAALQKIRIDEFFGRTTDGEAGYESGQLNTFLLAYFRDHRLSLRQVGQAIHRLGLVFASLRSDQRSFGLFAAVALIVRTIDENLYHQFCNGRITDLEAVKELGDRLTPDHEEAQRLRRQMEAVLIIGGNEFASSTFPAHRSVISPLFDHYRAIAEQEESEGDEADEVQQYAQSVVSFVQVLLSDPSYRRITGFKHTVERIELFSSVLLGDATKEEEK